jgi:pimeloyl-ACP methyl ester carboxylesterase
LVKRCLVSFVALGAVLASTAGVVPAQAGGSTPVLIVGGLTEPQASLDTLQGRLENAGLTVFTMALPGAIPGTQDIAVSAQAVASRARQVLDQTGAAKLDVVGHSEGGLALRYYIRNLGGAAQVRRYVSLATPQHGTQLANIIGAFPIVGQLAGGCLRRLRADGGRLGVPGGVEQPHRRAGGRDLYRPRDPVRRGGDPGAAGIVPPGRRHRRHRPAVLSERRRLPHRPALRPTGGRADDQRPAGRAADHDLLTQFPTT